MCGPTLLLLTVQQGYLWHHWWIDGSIACGQAVITGLVEMTESNSTLLVPVLEAISNITAQDTGQVLY